MRKIVKQDTQVVEKAIKKGMADSSRRHQSKILAGKAFILVDQAIDLLKKNDPSDVETAFYIEDFLNAYGILSGYKKRNYDARNGKKTT